MYIKEKYWENGLGYSDDSLTFLEHLLGKEKISVKDIFSDFGLNKMNGNFRNPEIPVIITNSEGWQYEIHYAIELVITLAVLLLECKVNGGVSLHELLDLEGGQKVSITATLQEHELINRTLLDFVTSPSSYNLSEMMLEEEMTEMVNNCEELRKELYE